MNKELKGILTTGVENLWFTIPTNNAKVTTDWKGQGKVNQKAQEIIDAEVGKVKVEGVDVDIEADF